MNNKTSRKNWEYNTDVGKVLTEAARHEHVARRFGDFEGAIRVYTTQLGYTLVKKFAEVAFVRRGDDWVEIVPNTMPEHEAFAVPTREDYTALFESFNDEGVALKHFEVLTESLHDSDAICRAMFRHVGTGLLVQIIWRAEQIFEDLFPSETEDDSPVKQTTVEHE